MDSERYQRLSELFSRASAMDVGKRTAFLTEACGGDPELREEIESLLAFDEQADDLLSATSMGDHIRSLVEELDPDLEPAHPEKVGHYKILGLLGEGGQGIVFKAEQPTPRRIVALKVLRAGSFATKDDLRRFRREIQALAHLGHPAIATIFDGGHTDEGHHFFTMEFVDGSPINVYARKESLPLDKRLELFCRICDGVHYAHEKGIIHRDLKPTNILVDADANPKILDFGLVRITSPDVSNVSFGSKTGFVVGSFRYMSPEQASGKQEDIKTQTDLYSLGVILYELLTGKRPYEFGPSLPEAVTTICEVVPPPPSAVDRAFRGDLDTIVSTALEKDPSRRYGSVAQLACDIRSFLRGEPISVTPTSPAYVLSRKIRKHRIGIALFVTAFAIGAVWFGFRWWEMRSDLMQARQRAILIQWTLERAPAERMLGTAHSLHEGHPTLPEAGLVAAQAQFRAGVEHGPIRYIRLGIDNGREVWAFRLLLARIYRGTNPQLADRMESQALLEFPDTADAWHLRSFTTFDLNEAVRSANSAIERDPNHSLATARLAYLCERVGNLVCAHEAAGRLLESRRSKHDHFLWSRFQTFILMRQGRYRDALTQYDSLLAEDPMKRSLIRDRATAHLCLKDYGRAVADYTALAGESHASASWVYRWRATPLWMLGRLEDASNDYERFRRMEGTVSYVDARLFLLKSERARRLEDQGLSAEASKLLEEARSDLNAARRGAEEGSWLRKVLSCLAGELTPEALIRLADRTDREQVCESYYYAAEMRLLQGRSEDARGWFGSCVATGLPFDVNEYADPMSEYHLAIWRGDQLADGQYGRD